MDAMTSVVLLASALLTGGSHGIDQATEYCQDDYFDAQCGANQMILMTAAKYGRMHLGRCVESDYGHLGCSADALGVMDSLCSGRVRCEFRIFDSGLKNLESPCPDDVTSYLQASYTCVNVASPSPTQCRSDKVIALEDTQQGYLASFLAENQGIGTSECPWLIRAKPGQTIAIYLLNFGAISSGSSRPGCYELVVLTDGNDSHSVTTCDVTDRDTPVFTSISHQLTLQVASPDALSSLSKFLLKYEVMGCANRPIPANSTMSRRGNTLVVRCNKVANTWTLVCENKEWRGELGNCTGVHSDWLTGEQSGEQQFPYGILVVVAIGVALGVFCGGLLLTCAAMYMKKRRRHQHTESHSGTTGDAFMTHEEQLRERQRALTDTLQRKQYPASYYGRAGLQCYDDSCFQNTKNDGTNPSPACCKPPIDVTQITGTLPHSQRSHFYESPRVV